MHNRHERYEPSGLRQSSYFIQSVLRLFFFGFVVGVAPHGVSADRQASSSVHDSSFSVAAAPPSLWRCSRGTVRPMSLGEVEGNKGVCIESGGMLDTGLYEPGINTIHSHQPLTTTSNRLTTCTVPPTRWRLSRRRHNPKRRLSVSDILKCRSLSLLRPDEVIWSAIYYNSINWRGGSDWFGGFVDDGDSIDELPSSTDSSTFAVSSIGPSNTAIQTSRGTLDGNAAGTDKNPKKVRRSHSPVVYQYYGRSRNRGQSSPEAPHFLLLGPNVDHWKAVGQILASRGFNVMVCERIIDAEDAANAASISDKNKKNWNRPQQLDSNNEANDAPDLVLDMLGMCDDQSHVQNYDMSDY